MQMLSAPRLSAVGLFSGQNGWWRAQRRRLRGLGCGRARRVVALGQNSPRVRMGRGCWAKTGPKCECVGEGRLDGKVRWTKTATECECVGDGFRDKGAPWTKTGPKCECVGDRRLDGEVRWTKTAPECEWRGVPMAKHPKSANGQGSVDQNGYRLRT